MKPPLGTCDKCKAPHALNTSPVGDENSQIAEFVNHPPCVNFVSTPSKWKQMLSNLGNVIGESLFGGQNR